MCFCSKWELLAMQGSMTKSLQSTSPVIRENPENRYVQLLKTLKGLFRYIGSGFIIGVSDDYLSGIAAYAQRGAIFGNSQLWLVWFTCPFMIGFRCKKSDYFTNQVKNVTVEEINQSHHLENGT